MKTLGRKLKSSSYDLYDWHAIAPYNRIILISLVPSVQNDFRMQRKCRNAMVCLNQVTIIIRASLLWNSCPEKLKFCAFSQVEVQMINCHSQFRKLELWWEFYKTWLLRRLMFTMLITKCKNANAQKHNFDKPLFSWKIPSNKQIIIFRSDFEKYSQWLAQCVIWCEWKINK